MISIFAEPRALYSELLSVGGFLFRAAEVLQSFRPLLFVQSTLKSYKMTLWEVFYFQDSPIKASKNVMYVAFGF